MVHRSVTPAWHMAWLSNVDALLSCRERTGSAASNKGDEDVWYGSPLLGLRIAQHCGRGKPWGVWMLWPLLRCSRRLYRTFPASSPGALTCCSCLPAATHAADAADAGVIHRPSALRLLGLTNSDVGFGVNDYVQHDGQWAWKTK